MGKNSDKIPVTDWKKFTRNSSTSWVWFNITAVVGNNKKSRTYVSRLLEIWVGCSTHY